MEGTEGGGELQNQLHNILVSRQECQDYRSQHFDYLSIKVDQDF